MSVIRRNRRRSTSPRPRKSKMPAIPHMRDARSSEIGLHTRTKPTQSIFQGKNPRELLVIPNPVQLKQSAQDNDPPGKYRFSVGACEITRPIGRRAADIFNPIGETAQPGRAQIGRVIGEPARWRWWSAE